MNHKLIQVDLQIEYIAITENNKKQLQQEFDSLGEHNQDPIGSYIKLAKARGETRENDDLLLSLIIELHRKIDNLENILLKKEDTRLPLNYSSPVLALGHTHLQITNLDIMPQSKFYGRIKIPVFPPREIPLYFSSTKGNIGKIDFMHNKDSIDYDMYITARERSLIRQMKGLDE